jgi:hypothetical protein
MRFAITAWSVGIRPQQFPTHYARERCAWLRAQKESFHGMVEVSDAALGLLDSFIYDVLDLEVTSDGDLAVANHPLIVREIAQQGADLSDLSKSDDRKAVLAIWGRSKI